ncbi:MAG: hypothetical protein HY900_08195 [Deltaproteobacteria bacterium]|nr:hypothetical protein [Deltaproteobacteria bacterium]
MLVLLKRATLRRLRSRQTLQETSSSSSGSFRRRLVAQDSLPLDLIVVPSRIGKEVPRPARRDDRGVRHGQRAVGQGERHEEEQFEKDAVFELRSAIVR